MAPRPATIPECEFNTAFSFFGQVKARFASDPAVYDAFLGILRDFSRGVTTDCNQVTADVYALVRGHPDLVHRLGAFLPTPERAREDPAPSRPKRERRPAPTAAAAVAPSFDGAMRYLSWLREVGLFDRLLPLIFDATKEDVYQIYKRARKIFGAHSDLLSEFTEYLPIMTRREEECFSRRFDEEEQEPSPELEHRAPAPRRKAAAVNVADNPGAAKRPRADDLKTTSRRAHSPAAVDAAPKSVSAFREAWEFETTYTKLVATARRTKELLDEYEPPEDGAPEDAPAPLTRGRRAFEELFPSRECQEVLREMYHGMLGHIREALEDGARTELALRTIKRRLGMLEQAAVKMAMERRDRARVEGRMQKLAVDRVLVLRKIQAKQSAGM